LIVQIVFKVLGYLEMKRHHDEIEKKWIEHPLSV
jgi:hypothetical protein